MNDPWCGVPGRGSQPGRDMQISGLQAAGFVSHWSFVIRYRAIQLTTVPPTGSVQGL